MEQNASDKTDRPDGETPSLSLLASGAITAEQIEDLYRQLTGKEPTPEESARLREGLAKPK